MDVSKERTELINTLFATFPREYGISDADLAKRKAVYIAMLSDLPTNAIRLACRKAYLEEDRLPSIAKLVAAVKSLIGEVNEENRIKAWSEAWKEIVKQMYATPYGKKPKWSTPEIEEAVNTFDWNRLQTIEAGDAFSVAESQIRRYYEQICKRKAEQGINSYILQGNNNLKTLSNGSRTGVDERKSLSQGNLPPKEEKDA